MLEDILAIIRSPTPDYFLRDATFRQQVTEYNEKCQAIGMDALPILLDVLREGSEFEDEQIGAIFFIRALGLDADVRNDEGPDRYYVVQLTPGSDWVEIHPRIPPIDRLEWEREQIRKMEEDGTGRDWKRAFEN